MMRWTNMMGMMPRRRNRNRGMNTVTAMVMGAGIGIAAYELMRRNNVAGRSNDSVANMADDMMDAMQ